MLVVLGACVAVAYHVVSALARILAPLAGGQAPVFAIIACTAIVRLLLLPLSFYSLRGQASQARLLPQVRQLQQQYARQPERLQRELGLLYRTEGTGMFAGCLPALLQLPFFSVLYRLFLSRTIDGRPNGLLSHDLLGAPLGGHWLGGPGPVSVQGAVFGVLFALLAVVAWLSARSARRAATAQAGGAARRAETARAGGQAGGAVGVLTRVLPYTTVAVAAVVPLAAGIYLLTSSAWAAGERRLLRRKAAGQGPAGPPRRDRRRAADVPGVIRSA
jgi:YidC/Oxa1 family membrane protein insertase